MIMHLIVPNFLISRRMHNKLLLPLLHQNQRAILSQSSKLKILNHDNDQKAAALVKSDTTIRRKNKKIASLKADNRDLLHQLKMEERLSYTVFENSIVDACRTMESAIKLLEEAQG